MPNSRPKIIVYVSCIKKFGSSTSIYTIHDIRRFRVSCSELCYTSIYTLLVYLYTRILFM